MLYDHDYEALRKMLKNMRRGAGLSQVQLAHTLGRGQSYISKVERGEQYLDVLEFVAWCKACGKQPGTLIERI
jgi:transcriptional regulator with XRE-family HTH domain